MRKLWLLLLISGALFFSSTISLGQLAPIQMSVDTPSPGAAIFQNFAVVGWALDISAGMGNGPGIDRIEIYEGTECEGELIGQGAPTISRANNADVFSLDDSFDLNGYNIPIDVDEAGLFTFTVCAISSVDESESSKITRDIEVMPDGILLNVDYLYDGGPIVQNTVITGWAVDPRAGEGQGPGIEVVRVVLGDTCQGDVLAESAPSEHRTAEIGALNLDASYRTSGFTILVDDLPLGTATLTVCAISAVDQIAQSDTFTLTVYKSDTMPLWPLILVILTAFSLLFASVVFAHHRSGSTSIWSRPWFIALYIGLSLIPAIIVMLYIHHYAVNVPLQDEWQQSIIAYIRNLTDGFNFNQHWELHNEHRTFVPGIIGLVIAQLTSANVLALVFLNFVIAILMWMLLYSLYRSTSQSEKHYFILLPAAVLLFSMVIWPRWMDSRPFRLSSAILFFILSLRIIMVGERNLRTVFIAGIFAALSSLSFFTGNYTWIVVGAAMLFLRYFKIRYYILWMVMAAMVLVPYVLDFANSDTVARQTASPGLDQLIEFVMLFIGSPLAPYRTLASQTEPMLLGALGLSVVAILGVYNLLLVQNGFRKSLPWLAIIGWVVLNAATAGYGRISQYGLIIATTLRYMIYGLLFWTSLFALIGIALFEPKQIALERWKRHLYRLRYAMNIVLVGLMLFIAYWYVDAYQATLQNRWFLQQVVQLRATSGCLYDSMNAPDDCFDNVYAVEPLRKMAYLAGQSRVSWLEVDTYRLAARFANPPKPEETSIRIDDRIVDAFLQPPEHAASWTIYIPNGVQTVLHTTLILPEAETEDFQYSIVASANENPVELSLNISSESDANRIYHQIEADLTPFAGEKITLSFIASRLEYDEVIWVVPTIQYVED